MNREKLDSQWVTTDHLFRKLLTQGRNSCTERELETLAIGKRPTRYKVVNIRNNW